MGLSVKADDKMFSFAAAYFARPSLTLSAVPATGSMLFGTRYDHFILMVSSSTIDKIYEITLFTKIGTKSALFTKIGTKFS